MSNTTLKQRLTEYYGERESEFDPEETKNVLEILSEYNEDLKGLSNLDQKLLLRMIDDEELYAEVDSIEQKSDPFGNVFD